MIAVGLAIEFPREPLVGQQVGHRRLVERVVWSGNIRPMKTTLAVLLLVIAAWLIALNWWSFYLSFIRKMKAPSWIPLLGGLLAWAGVSLIPDREMWAVGWIALILDWGSIPGIAHAIYVHTRTSQQNES